MIEIELPDGSIAEFPDGTPQDTIKSALQKRFGAPKRGFQVGEQPLSDTLAAMPDPNAPEQVSTLDALKRGFSDMATFGTADEVSGFINSLISGDSYANERDQLRAELAQAQEQRPLTTLAGGATGGILQGIFTGGLLGGAPATTTAARALQGAKIGAVEGAAYGLGSGEGGLDRVLDAGKYGGIGGMIGGAAPVAIDGVRRGADYVLGGPIASMRSAPSQVRASRAVQTAIDRSGQSADEVADAIAAARAAGQPYSIADATGYSGQRMLAGAARTPGDARQEIIDYLVNRQSGQGRRIGGALDEALNAPRNVGNLPAIPGQNAADFTGQTANQVEQALTSARGQAADVAYEAARRGAAPVDVRGAVAAIDDRIGPMQGSGIRGDGIDAKLAGYRSRLAANTPGPKFEGADAVELSDFDRVLGVKQAIQDDIGAAVRAGRNNEARELNKIVTQLDQALEGSSEGYRSANDSFRQASRVIDQIDAGKSATSPRARVSDNLAGYGNLTPEQQAAFRVGYSDPLMARIEGAAPGVNKARPLLDDATQAELGAMARRPDELADFLRREDQMFRTGNAAMGGSMTADNLADAGDITALGSNAIVNLLTGRFGAAASQIGQTVLDGAAGRNTSTRDQIARLLLSGDVQGALAPAAQRAVQNAKRSAVVEALMRGGGRAIQGYLSE